MYCKDISCVVLHLLSYEMGKHTVAENEVELLFSLLSVFNSQGTHSDVKFVYDNHSFLSCSVNQ